MWTVKQHSAGYYYCENGTTGDTTDRTWTTEGEAQEWAKQANEKAAATVAENKKRAAERAARRGKPITETHRMLEAGNDLTPPGANLGEPA